MDLRRLRYFQAVAEELSFSRAARRLHVAQPALSRAVQEIEADLGTPVLERSRHHVRLTPAGAVLLRETARTLEVLEEGLRRVRRTGAGEEGELRLGYVGPPCRPFLGRLLAEYRRRYPGVALELEERTPERVWERVAQGRLAAGITRPVTGQEALGMRTVLLRDEVLGLALPAGHRWVGRARVRWAELAAEPLVVLARREGMNLHDTLLAACRQAGFTPRLARTPSLIGTVLLYAEAGAGLAVVTESVFRAGGALRFVALRPRFTVPLVLAWNEDQDSPAVARFRELLLEWRGAERLWPGAEARSLADGGVPD